jgi:hypothetical protein
MQSGYMGLWKQLPWGIKHAQSAKRVYVCLLDDCKGICWLAWNLSGPSDVFITVQGETSHRAESSISVLVLARQHKRVGTSLLDQKCASTPIEDVYTKRAIYCRRTEMRVLSFQFALYVSLCSPEAVSTGVRGRRGNMQEGPFGLCPTKKVGASE